MAESEAGSMLSEHSIDDDAQSDALSRSSFFERFTFEVLDADARLKLRKR